MAYEADDEVKQTITPPEHVDIVEESSLADDDPC